MASFLTAFRVVRALALATLVFVLECPAQSYLNNLRIDHPAIRYFDGDDNAVSRLARALETGKATLSARNDRFGYLPDLLQHLAIPTDSQALVFSKSSFQGAKVSPHNPRAIYFNDEVAVGFVPGGTGIEVAAVDPNRGVVLYSLRSDASGRPSFERNKRCISCHQGPSTLGVPGLFVGSVFPNIDGAAAREGAIVTDHRTPFADRWGGWYVNARQGEHLDRANAVATNPADPQELDEGREQNLHTLAGRINVAKYLEPTSDIVALMTLEHQTQMINYLTRLNWESRLAAGDANSEKQLSADVEAALRYLLFADEAPLAEPIAGISTFTSSFPQRGPRDHLGRSLREFDLKTRLFRYPLSYMIYSPLFRAIPADTKDQLYRRVYAVLSGQDASGIFSDWDRRTAEAAKQILEETDTDLPGWWVRKKVAPSKQSGGSWY